MKNEKDVFYANDAWLKAAQKHEEQKVLASHMASLADTAANEKLREDVATWIHESYQAFEIQDMLKKAGYFTDAHIAKKARTA